MTAAGATVVARAPGRVNLIGDHTDYTGGLVLPVAIDRATTVTGRRGGDAVHLESDAEAGAADVPLAIAAEAAAGVEPAWARYVAGVVAVLAPSRGFTGTVSSTVPPGAGLSSSAALEVAVALALGFDGPPLELARACQRAEHLASGVPCGIMDQLASAAGVAGHALLIDCRSFAVTPVPLPARAALFVVDSGERRALAGSAYASRRAACERAAGVAGPLRDASFRDLEAILDAGDEEAFRRARHVVTENVRVRRTAAALEDGDLATAGTQMVASHASLRDDFDVSTPALDALVDTLLGLPGVAGARLTGAGFGGCVIALAHAGTAVDLPGAWPVRAADGARVTTG